MARAKTPHRLELYGHAVQQPGATVALLDRIHRHPDPKGEPPLLLREDFAGTCAVAAAWCESHPQRQAMAVERHGPTLRWAAKRHGHLEDLHLVEADVMDLDRPRVDVVAALNFSTFGYHDPAALLAYLQHARRGLRPGGVLVLDAYGGPGAMAVGTQSRPADGFTYHWEQRSFDPLTHRTDCRIHFELPTPAPGTPEKRGKSRGGGSASRKTSGGSRWIKSAFRYDWRLWTLPELTGWLEKAGFVDVEVWAEAKTRGGAGNIRPVKKLPAEDWVTHLVGRR